MDISWLEIANRWTCCTTAFIKKPPAGTPLFTTIPMDFPIAGFSRREIYGDFSRRPLTRENDATIVAAKSLKTHFTRQR